MTRRKGDDDERIAPLAAQIAARRAVLFAGAGLSACLGLPSWRGLIEKLGEDLGYDPAEFLGMGADFRSLTEFYRLEKKSLRTLRSWMEREWAVQMLADYHLPDYRGIVDY